MTTTVTAVSVVVPTQALPRKNAVIAHAPQLVTNKPVSSLAAGNWAAHASRQGANASIATASRQVVVTSTPDLLLAQSTIFLEGGGNGDRAAVATGAAAAEDRIALDDARDIQGGGTQNIADIAEDNDAGNGPPVAGENQGGQPPNDAPHHPHLQPETVDKREWPPAKWMAIH